MAKLFVVKSGTLEQSTELEEEVFEASADTAADLETALRAFAFLIDWVESVGGSEGIRICAETVQEFRKEPR